MKKRTHRAHQGNDLAVIKIKNFHIFNITFFAGLLLSFAYWRLYEGLNMSDNSAYLQLLSSNTGFKLDNQYLNSGYDYLKNVIGSEDISKLEQLPQSASTYSTLSNHAYFILYPLKVLSYFISPVYIFVFLIGLIIVLPFFLVVTVILRELSIKKKTVLIVPALSLLVIFGLHPGTLWAGYGQFYPDRLAIIFIPLIMLTLERIKGGQKANYAQIFLLITTILAISCTERSALYVGLIYLTYGITPAISNKTLLSLNKTYCFVGITLSIYFYLYMKYVSINLANDSFLSTLMNYQINPLGAINDGTLTFLIFLSPIILLLWRNWDLQVLVFLSVAPNILSSIGGAEKVGWVTHYMANVTSICVGSALICLLREVDMMGKKVLLSEGKKLQNKNINNKVEKRYGVGAKKFMAPAILAIVTFLLFDPLSKSANIEFPKKERFGLWGQMFRWYENTEHRDFVISRRIEIELLAKKIPTNSRVSVTEATSSFLSPRVRFLDYYPFGIPQSDYVLIESVNGINDFMFSKVTIYSSATNSFQLTNQVTKILKSSCYKKVGVANKSGIYLFERNQLMSNKDCLALK